MTQEDLNVFFGVMNSGSVTAAAKAMNMAQSTVSKRLRLLENELGYRLVERAKGIKQLRLTKEGKRFSEIAWRFLELYREARELGSLKRLTLNIGTAPSANMTFMPDVCMRMLDLEPDMQIKLYSQHSQEMYDAVDKRMVDVGFSQVERVHTGVNVKPCFSVSMLGIRRKGGRLPSSVPVQELDAKKCIHVPWGTRYEMWHNHWFHSGEQSQLSVDNAYVLFTLLLREGSWSIVPLDIAHMLMTSGNFATFNLTPAPVDRVFFKLTHKYPSPEAQSGTAIFDSCLAYVLHGAPSEAYKDIRI